MVRNGHCWFGGSLAWMPYAHASRTRRSRCRGRRCRSPGARCVTPPTSCSGSPRRRGARTETSCRPPTRLSASSCCGSSSACRPRSLRWVRGVGGRGVGWGWGGWLEGRQCGVGEVRGGWSVIVARITPVGEGRGVEAGWGGWAKGWCCVGGVRGGQSECGLDHSDGVRGVGVGWEGGVGGGVGGALETTLMTEMGAVGGCGTLGCVGRARLVPARTNATTQHDPGRMKTMTSRLSGLCSGTSLCRCWSGRRRRRSQPAAPSSSNRRRIRRSPRSRCVR